MYFSTQYYGRKGLVVNAISGVDLALWDLLGKLGASRSYQMLGGPVRDELTFYATGARPDLAKKMGFIGGKLPLHHGPAEGEEGLAKNIAMLADMRSKVGPDFWLMLDCWMSPRSQLCGQAGATRTITDSSGSKKRCLRTITGGYADLKRNGTPRGMLVTTGGKHEATRWKAFACCSRWAAATASSSRMSAGAPAA